MGVVKHSMSGTRTWRIWQSMKQRCAARWHPGYGGRGIGVAVRWTEFANFLADMGECPSIGHSLDRIDNNGDYTPGNCRWATAKQQCRNHRRNVRLTAFGETKTVAEWAEDPRCTVPQARIYTRIRKLRWSAEAAITEDAYARYGSSVGRRRVSSQPTTNKES